jgi:Na+-transporting methylmalonyl-CoA/oxaloacetate decarboxylase gamma subunit
MNFKQELQISLTVLLTGLVVVFLMLIFLTLVIKGYGSAVQFLQAKYHKRQPKNQLSVAPHRLAEIGLHGEWLDYWKIRVRFKSDTGGIGKDW